MTTGRTTLNHSRVYVDGYDMSGYSRDWTQLACTYAEGVDDAINKTVKATVLGQASVTMGPLNGLFDNTAASGIHTVMPGKTGTLCDVMVALGIQAAPAAGDPVFVGQFESLGYTAGSNENPVTATIPFGNWSARASSLLYSRPWGTLLHALSAVTDVNAANGHLTHGNAAQTTKGGYMMYHISDAAGTGNMTATLKTQNSATAGGVYADLLSTGVLNLGSSGTFGGPYSGIVALATNATVEAYTRWQIVLTLATSVTFALAFVRGNQG
jgi:hypothetical protein